MKHLVVTQPFGNYGVGEVISDPDAMKDAKASRPHCVVAITAHKEKTPASKAVKADISDAVTACPVSQNSISMKDIEE